MRRNINQRTQGRTKLIDFVDKDIEIVHIPVMCQRSTVTVLLLGYKMAPKAYVWRAWCPASGADDRDRDSIMKALTPSLGWSIEECTLNELLGGGAWLQEVGHEGMPLKGMSCFGLLPISPPPRSPAVKWPLFLCHSLPTWHTLPHHTAQKHRPRNHRQKL